MKGKIFSIRVDEETYEVLKYISEKEDRTLGNLCRKVLSDYVSKKANERVE
ncbi:MAG: DNA-binding protein [Clostridia bacterium]